jgi:allophanate hydrolase
MHLSLSPAAAPADAFGQFVATIPPPLGIGSIELDDGSTAKGFLVESVGLLGASDISSSTPKARGLGPDRGRLNF